MSRIGRQPIEIPQGVSVTIEGSHVSVKGPKGELERRIRPEIEASLSDNVITVAPKKGARKPEAMWGLTRSLIANMVQGVAVGYEKKLEIEGVGYRAEVTGDGITLNMGFSHPVVVKAPENVAFSIDNNVITVSGPDKEKVGQFASSIKKVKPVEPYKGKGIKYEGEYVRRKLGKRAAGEGAVGAV